MKLLPTEAQRIAAIFAEADGGCPVCTRHLAEKMQEIAPDYDWVELVESIRRPSNFLAELAGL